MFLDFLADLFLGVKFHIFRTNFFLEIIIPKYNELLGHFNIFYSFCIFKPSLKDQR